MATIRQFESLTVKEVSLVSAGANQPAFVTLFKSKNSQEKVMTEIEKAAADKAAADALAAEAAATAAAEKAAADKAAAEATELSKALTEIEKAKADLAKAQAALATAQADVEKANAEKTELDKALKAEKRAALVTSAQGRVTKTMKCIPGVQATIAENLVALSEASPALAAFVEEAFVKSSALIEKGGLAVVADVPKDEVDGGSAIEKAKKLTDAKIAANPKLSRAKAEAEVWSENKDLYKQYETEKAAQ